MLVYFFQIGHTFFTYWFAVVASSRLAVALELTVEQTLLVACDWRSCQDLAAERGVVVQACRSVDRAGMESGVGTSQWEVGLVGSSQWEEVGLVGTILDVMGLHYFQLLLQLPLVEVLGGIEKVKER